MVFFFHMIFSIINNSGLAENKYYTALNGSHFESDASGASSESINFCPGGLFFFFWSLLVPYSYAASADFRSFSVSTD